jgi:hypothetical protein
MGLGAGHVLGFCVTRRNSDAAVVNDNSGFIDCHIKDV